MVNINLAISYVKQNGNELDRARLKGILLKTPPAVDIIQKLQTLQNPDGGFSYWTKECSTIFDTVYLLAWLDDLQLMTGELIDNAFKFLISQQKDDGSWDEVSEVENYDSEFSLKPGELETRVFLTAFSSHWFVRFDRSEPPEAKGCPVEFLKANITESGLILDDQQATWDSLVLFSYYPGRDSDLFKETLEIIEKKFTPEELTGSSLAYLLCSLRDAKLEAFHPLVNLCTDELNQKQRNDGSWESEYGEEYSASATVDALRVMKYFNVG